MYRQLDEGNSFSRTFSTWIIAYCLDTDSFFATNQRNFFWEHYAEFLCESDAIKYFRDHIGEFWDARKNILCETGGWKIDKDLFLENTTELFRVINTD